MKNIYFVIRGRLGNAIFRYLACSIMCLFYEGSYNINKNNENYIECSDEFFLQIKDKILENELLPISNVHIKMNCFYQHCDIYVKYKKEIKTLIINHPEHFILTDGITAGDNNCEKFYMKDILITPENFKKKYKNVLHIRLEDFVTYNLFLQKERITILLEKIKKLEEICIVCKKPISEFEMEYIGFIRNFLKEKNIQTFIEHNDVLTDYYIMKEAELLICSKSTLSWAAAFFSENLKKCYIPEYESSINSTFKYPTENTEFY